MTLPATISGAYFGRVGVGPEEIGTRGPDRLRLRDGASREREKYVERKGDTNSVFVAATSLAC